MSQTHPGEFFPTSKNHRFRENHTFLRLNQEPHRFSSPDQLHSICRVILHRKGYVRIGNKESAKFNSKLQKKYKWYIKPDSCIRKAIKFYVGSIRSESQFDAVRQVLSKIHTFMRFDRYPLTCRRIRWSHVKEHAKIPLPPCSGQVEHISTPYIIIDEKRRDTVYRYCKDRTSGTQHMNSPQDSPYKTTYSPYSEPT